MFGLTLTVVTNVVTVVDCAMDMAGTYLSPLFMF